MREFMRMYGPMALALLIAYLLFKYVMAFILPFVLAVILAVIIEPVVAWLDRRTRVSRGLAVSLVLVIVFGLVSFLLVVGVASLVVEIGTFQEGIPELYKKAESSLTIAAERFGVWRESLPQEVQMVIEEQQVEWLERAQEWLEQNTGQWLKILQRVALTDIPMFLVVLGVMAIATFFISKDKDVIKQSVMTMVPEPWRRPVMDVSRQLLSSTVGFLYAVLLLAIVTTVILLIGLAIMRSPYALMIAVLSGVLDFIPIIGPGLIFVPWIVYSLIFGNVGYGLALTAVYGVAVAVRTVLQAKVIGDRLGIHPLTTLVAIYVGVRLLGAIGFVLGPLLVVLLKTVADTQALVREP